MSVQLLQFLKDHKIITKGDNDQYHWHFNNSEYEVPESVVKDVVNSILKEWAHKGMEDINYFEKELKMTQVEVIRMVRNLVKMELGSLCGVA